jgi:putative aldouronate transport system substrate-binding protein
MLTLLPMASAEEEPVKLKIKIRHIGYTTDYHTKISDELNKRLNIDVEWELSPSENYAQQSTMLIAGGDYPDAMEYACSVYPLDIQNLAEDGVIIPLDDLLQEYGQEILKQRSEDFLWYTADDGHIYSISGRQQEYSNSLWQIRQDWLDKLGLQVPTTLDEIHDVLVAFKENSDLLVGEGNVLIPYGNCQNFTDSKVQSLIYAAHGFSDQWIEVDGHAAYYINHPNFKEALLVWRQWQQEGLIDPEWPLMNREQSLEKWYKGQYGMFQNLLDNTDPAFHIYIPIFLENNPEAELSFVMPPEGPNGEKLGVTASTTFNQMIIFSDTTEEQRIALMKLFNYMISEEGSDLVEMGIEGEDWEEIGDTGRATFFPLATDEERAELGYYSFNWCMKRNYFPRWNSEITLGAGAQYAEYLSYPSVIATPDAQLEYGVVLNDLVKSSITELVLTPDIDFDAKFDEFIANWHAYGGAELTEQMDAIYQAKK